MESVLLMFSECYRNCLHGLLFWLHIANWKVWVIARGNVLLSSSFVAWCQKLLLAYQTPDMQHCDPSNSHSHLNNVICPLFYHKLHLWHISHKISNLSVNVSPMLLKYLRHEGKCVQYCWCSLVTKNMAIKYIEPFYALCRKPKKIVE